MEVRVKEKSMQEIIAGLPDEVREELDLFERQVEDYLAGMTGEIKFQKIRLQMGVYAQRQDGVQMQRIKIPFGGLNSAQLRRLADVSDKYASGFMHLTTRQDVQLYYIQLDTEPNMMRELADVGITTREACGNTVRNVTACHQSGVSPTQNFDVTPYAEAFKNFMLRNPICQNMGRKFKVCFEGCHDKDHAGIMIHDLGFRARVKEIDGELKRGFQVYVGGGLGASPSLGHLWTEFLPVEEMIPFSASVIRIFDRFGERKVRMKARMKFLIRKLGIDEFREKVEEERAKLDVDPKWNDFLKEIDETPPETNPHIPSAPEGVSEDPLYQAWKDSCVLPHEYEGFNMVNISVHNGDITSDTARALADITEIFSASDIRISISQNLILRWVPTAALPALYLALREIDLANLGPETFNDITACPGADTCRLGITSAKGLADTLTKGMKNGLGEFSELSKGLSIKISGCPNACAQHVSANIGFQGASLAKEGRNVPAEQVFVGGGLYGDDTRLATSIIKVATRNAPKVVKRLLELYRDERNGDEHFDLVMERLGRDRIKEEIKEFAQVPTFEEDPSYYQDWGHEEEKFELQKGVKGECAGATVEEKIPTFSDAEKRIQQAEALLKHGEYNTSIMEAYHSCAASAHVPLYTKLVDPFTSQQTIWEFENLLVRTGDADERWLDISGVLKDMLDQAASEELAVEMLEIAKDLYTECERIQTNLM
ncbi:MAG: nitrite reductase [Candidatus Dadabacteria bacterium]|nr:nitrite reductase [Candidatus Dadabacteria bacterium]